MTPTSFDPPRRTLMGPGPADVHPRVLAALSRPTIGHLDPAFVGFMDEVKVLLQHAFQTSNALTLPISGPGSAGMEAALANVIEPGDTVVVATNGYFSGRMAEMAARQGGEVVRVDEPWGRAGGSGPAGGRRCAITRGRRSWRSSMRRPRPGVLSDAKTLTEIAHRHGAIVVMDAVTSLGGVPVLVDAWGIDVVFSGSQKCLGAPPGLAPITFGPRALEVMDRRRTPMSSWFFDMSLVRGYWSGGVKRAYHHTAPSNALYGLHEALVMLQEEGLENSWERHRRNHFALIEGLDAMGLSLLVPQGRPAAAVECGRGAGGCGRGAGAHADPERVQPRDRRGVRRAGRQDLARRPHGALVAPRERRALPARAGGGAGGDAAGLTPRRPAPRQRYAAAVVSSSSIFAVRTLVNRATSV